MIGDKKGYDHLSWYYKGKEPFQKIKKCSYLLTQLSDSKDFIKHAWQNLLNEVLHTTKTWKRKCSTFTECIGDR